MSKQLIELVLPRLARNLSRELERYRSGKLNENQFTDCFEDLLQRQHSWLTNRGVPELRAALAIHGAVLVLSAPGLRAEAAEKRLPLEIVEYRATREAALDVARNYDISEQRAMQAISAIVARYSEY
jgi:hypothetical protein